MLDPSQSVARKKLGIEPEARANGGFTVSTPRGVVCEVYVEGNMPARRIANVAFHEMMHNKLEMGNEMHSRLRGGGRGLALLNASEATALTPDNIELMAEKLFGRVPQYTGAM